MATYNSVVARASSGSDPLVPEPVSAQIIQEMTTQSVMLQRAKKVQLSAKTERLPVLDVLPMAYWVTNQQSTGGTDGGSDTGLKQTTNQEWANVTLIVEELASIVPIPEAYLDDAQVPLWDEIRPRLAESLGYTLDAAALFGVDKPATWPTDIYHAAVAAGNLVVDGTTKSQSNPAANADLGELTTQLGEKIALDGYSVDGFAARPGLNWRLASLRNTQGTPIFQPNMNGSPGGNLYGYGVSEVNNGSFDATRAQLIAGDWSKAVLGMRQDITFKLFTEGVISDGAGKVLLNLMQQDSVAMRVTMRVAYVTANPVTRLNSDGDTRFAFGVVQTAGAGS